ncbi:MAG: uracil-DNA glycosylase [Gammaproteobacteria bacterium]|nr:MAG: uracil-DNA glycosylase [Gammaproteobacteria bacterium]
MKSSTVSAAARPPAWLDRLPAAWASRLDGAVPPAHWAALDRALAARRAAGAVIFPPQADWFAALAATPPDEVKVVIVGQDPYHGPGQAHGLAFSVPPGVAVPPSLRNVFKELSADLGLAPPGHGCLAAWAGRGVLLLNTVLTVEQGRPGSHRGLGWERVTDAVLAILGDAAAPPRVFLLWGAPARAKAALIDRRRHAVFSAAHPSPLSAHRGFFGSRPFSRANAWLEAAGRGPVDWRLPAYSPAMEIEV